MSDGPCPLNAAEVVDQYFLEHRAKVLDVAAFLDRLDRSTPKADQLDHRVEALLACIALLNDGNGDRTRRIQKRLSDQTTSPIAAAPMQGATGAPEPGVNQ
jgi:hypothetical protein